MSNLTSDLRYAVRMLAKSPGFTAVGIITLGLGIGANTAIFSFIDGVLLKPQPYPDPDHLVVLWERPPTAQRMTASTLNFLDWKSQSTLFTSLAGATAGPITVSGANEPMVLRGALVSASYFDLFGVPAATGRTFAPDDDQEGKPGVAIVSHKVWQERFGGDPRIIGRKLVLNGKPHTLIGVLPKDSSYDRGRTEIWLPLVFTAQEMTRSYHWLMVYGRIKPGVTVDQVRAETQLISARIEEQYPDSNRGWGIIVDRFIDRVVGSDLRRSLYILLAAVGAVLLIGCANLANLTLARSTSRTKEVAIRVALGAGRTELIRQFLTENILLSTLGGLFGVWIGYAMIAGLKILVPPFMLPTEAAVALDSRVLLFTMAISVLTGLIFGLAPALQAASPNLTGPLKEGGRGSTSSKSRRRFRGALVVAETALAFVLLTGAGLLIRSFAELQEVNAGFDTTNVLAAGLPLSPSRITDASQAVSYTQRIVERVESIPGVIKAAITTAVPLTGLPHGARFQIVGKPLRDPANRDPSFIKMVSHGYFPALAVELQTGRLLTDKDSQGASLVAVINDSMVKRYFKGENPIGQRLQVRSMIFGKSIFGPDNVWEVVGVVADEKARGLDDARMAGLYVPYAQSPIPQVSLVVKSAVNPETLQQAIRREIQQIDGEQPLTEIRTLERIKTESMAPNRFRTMMLGGFAAVAQLLAAIGLYGVISYSVAQRTHEMGLRLALGASRLDILRLVMRDGLMLSGIGLLIGLAGAIALTRMMAALLFGVSPTDLRTLAAVAIVLTAVSLLACYIPASRATAVDPMVALRDE